MGMREIHECECEKCQSGVETEEKKLHEQMNLVMSRMDEQQRRWYAAVEANRRGHGGDKQVSEITGLDEKTIRRGKQEMEEWLVNRPVDRVRVAGGGRPAVEKKPRKSRVS